MARNPDLLRGTVELLILTTLQHGQQHGFGIARWLEEVSGEALKLEEGSLYPAIYRLEKAGLLSGKWEKTGARRGPRRRIYRLTSAGKKQLDSGRKDWRHFVATLGGILEVDYGRT